jgi:5-methylcytosine-specific restriction endonuclease McrA
VHGDPDNEVCMTTDWLDLPGWPPKGPWVALSCDDCGDILPVDEFFRNETYRMGVEPRCRLCRNARLRARYAESAEIRAGFRARAQRIPVERKRAYARASKKRNVEKVRADTNARRRRVRMQQPPWVDGAQLRDVYRKCPAGLEVDHVVPLRGALVSGLHVPWNLQYLSKEQNLRKGNRVDFI